MEAYLGTVCVFGFNYAPYGWAYCNGQILAISQNAALFALLGTYYGGNGTSTFGLPNLQGRNAIHMGQLTGGSLYTIGEFAGAETATVLISNMPAHNHSVSMTINANARGQSSPSPAGAYPAVSAVGVSNYNTPPASASVFMKPATITIGTSGGSVPVSISDPTLVMNYCIALTGIFPTRN